MRRRSVFTDYALPVCKRWRYQPPRNVEVSAITQDETVLPYEQYAVLG